MNWHLRKKEGRYWLCLRWLSSATSVLDCPLPGAICVQHDSSPSLHAHTTPISFWLLAADALAKSTPLTEVWQESVICAENEDLTELDTDTFPSAPQNVARHSAFILKNLLSTPWALLPLFEVSHSLCLFMFRMSENAYLIAIKSNGFICILQRNITPWLLDSSPFAPMLKVFYDFNLKLITY